METLLETISLDMEEANDLAFKVHVEGATGPATTRLVCEGTDVSYMFRGRSTGEGVIEFTVPQMSNKIQEGTYMARVEVLVENRYFAPVQFQIHFKKAVKVFAEAVKVAKPVLTPEVKVSAVSVQRAQPQQPSPPPVQKKPVLPAQPQQPKKSVVESKVIDDADSIRALIRDVLFAPKKSK